MSHWGTEGGAATDFPRKEVIRLVVGNFDPIPSADVHRVYLDVVSVVTQLGDPLAAGRVSRSEVVRLVFGGLDPTLSTRTDCVDLAVPSVVSVAARIGYPLAVWREGGIDVLRLIVGDTEFTPSAGGMV